jgi:hypothetical protein
MRAMRAILVAGAIFAANAAGAAARAVSANNTPTTLLPEGANFTSIGT